MNYAPEQIFCTGDILGYCAQPVECIALMQSWGVRSIAGNVELQLRDGSEDCGCDFSAGGRCDLFSRNWYGYTKAQLRPADIEWLHTLPQHISLRQGERKLLLVHGSWKHTSQFIFRSTAWQTKEEDFTATGAEIIVAGHCGLPFAHRRQNLLWLNAGVLGMPANDGTDRVWFATLEPSGAFRFHTLRYDHAVTSSLMRQQGLPAAYAQTLSTGIWDNCEILPPAETAQQGFALHEEALVSDE